MLTSVEIRDVRTSARGVSHEPRTRHQKGRSITAADGTNTVEAYSVSRLITIVATVERRVDVLRRSVEKMHDELRTLRHDVDALTRRVAPPRVPGRISLTTLTRQERRIALLVADGMSNVEVGAELRITAETVRGHLKNVFRKFGIRSRWELAYLLSPESVRTTSSLQMGATVAHSGAEPPLDVM
jgi:DNA-binding CsgD family transcriptional regulator